jgi:hypothetical protein
MPYYLVTHTSLIEADDEHAAAKNVIDQIRSGGEITVSVQSDESKIAPVVVGAKTYPESIRSVMDPIIEDPSVPASVVSHRLKVSRTGRLKRTIQKLYARLALRR